MTDSPFSLPKPPGGGDHPSMKQLKGRLLVFMPTQLDKDVPDTLSDKPGAVKDLMHANVAFLDGEPITNKLDKDGDVAKTFDEPITRGQIMEDFLTSNKLLVSQLKGQERVLGRLVQGTARAGQSKPWFLETPSEADIALAGKWWAKRGEEAMKKAANAIAAPTATPTPAAADDFDDEPAPAKQAPAAAPAAEEEDPF